MYFEPEFIDEVKQRADIVSIVQETVQLKKRGSTLMGLCPFHQERTPSFGVNKQRQFFNCFGCKTGGNVFQFLMLTQGLTFPQAVEEVASRYGIPLPERTYSPEYARKREEKQDKVDKILEANQLLAHKWNQELIRNPEAASYLHNRGIEPAAINIFNLGVSDNNWNSDSEFLQSKGVLPSNIIEFGLGTRSDKDGKIYDRFHSRLMFPVRDERGNVVAFSGRTLGSGEPKYLNSPETAAYVKGNHLYGLFENRNEIRILNFAILVEGQLDLVSLYQHGVRNVVCSLGTAFTDKQARLLARHTKNVCINFDGDEAGLKSARKAVPLLIAEGLNVKVFVMPEGSDPDAFVREQGKDGYHKARLKSIGGLEFFLKNSDLETKTERIEEAVGLVSLVQGEVEQREAFDHVMNFFSVADPEHRRNLWSMVKLNSFKDEMKDYLEQIDQPKPKVAEARILELMLSHSTIREHILEHLEETDYQNLVMRKQFEDIIAGKLVKDSRLKPLEISDEEPLDDYVVEAENCLTVLRQMSFDRRIKEVMEDLARFEKENDLENLQSSVREYTDLVNDKRKLYAVQQTVS